VGHGPKMGQYGFDRACFSVVYLFLLCFIAHLYEANGGGGAWKYWPASGPVFLSCEELSFELFEVIAIKEMNNLINVSN